MFFKYSSVGFTGTRRSGCRKGPEIAVQILLRRQAFASVPCRAYLIAIDGTNLFYTFTAASQSLSHGVLVLSATQQPRQY
jgi:hypothetical protein